METGFEMSDIKAVIKADRKKKNKTKNNPVELGSARGERSALRSGRKKMVRTG